MSDSIPIAVIGAGHLGSIHARVLSQLPGADLRFIVDLDGEKARAVANDHSATPLTDLDQLPAEIKAAVVATPTSEHHSVGCRLLERGIDVLIEKPLASTVEQAKELAELALEKRRILMVGHSERFNPVIRALAGYDLAPRFIDSQRVSPFTFRSADVGVVLDMMIHDIDIILHLIRSPVAHVHAVGVPVIGNTEDLANARLTFENGAVVNATASRVALKTERIMRLFSRDMYVTLDLHKKEGRVIKRGAALESGDLAGAEEVLRGITNPLEFMQRDLVRIEQLAIDDQEPLAVEDGAFLRSVRDRTEPPVTGQHGLWALETAQKIIASLTESLQQDNRREAEQGGA